MSYSQVVAFSWHDDRYFPGYLTIFVHTRNDVFSGYDLIIATFVKLMIFICWSFFSGHSLGGLFITFLLILRLSKQWNHLPFYLFFYKKFRQAESWDTCRAHLVYFSSLRDHCPSLPVSNIWKPRFCVFLFCFVL